jgi:hypothetical protein
MLCSQLLTFILFADDTNIFLSHNDIEALYKTMSQELKKVTLWLTDNKLSPNVNKTHYIIFKTRRKRPNHRSNLILNEKPILIKLIIHNSWDY